MIRHSHSTSLFHPPIVESLHRTFKLTIPSGASLIPIELNHFVRFDRCWPARVVDKIRRAERGSARRSARATVKETQV